jgi:exopolysaccharide biosynthesis WecB/TagA/CpsF family protein
MKKKAYQKIDNKLRSRKHFQDILTDKGDRTRILTFLNPFSYKTFIDNPKLISEFDSFYVDGALLVKLHNFFNNHKVDRLSFDFSSIANDVFEHAQTNKLAVAFIGAKEEELTGALSNLRLLYPNLNIVYSRNGYFQNETDYKNCFKSMRTIKIDILIIGMGSPYQEEFAVKVKHSELNISLIFTCGGFLTQTSIKPDYYYPIVKKLGLRWLQRAIMHKHVRDRLIKDYPIFIIKYIYNHILIKLKWEVK